MTQNIGRLPIIDHHDYIAGLEAEERRWLQAEAELLADHERQLQAEAEGRGWDWEPQWGPQPFDEHIRARLRTLSSGPLASC